MVSDPVASGIVKSLARPEANLTGLSNFLPATTGKLLELQELRAGGPVQVVAIEPHEVRTSGDIEGHSRP